MAMDINQNTTIITALYDIGRDKWSNFTMSYDTYLHWMNNTLSIDCNMLIYTEEKYKERILTTRLNVDPDLTKTKFIIQPLEELYAYKLFNGPLEQLMFSDEFKSKASFDVPEMTKPLYNVIMFNKMYFLNDALINNYFPEQQFLIWVDAGGLREDINNYIGCKWPDQSKLLTDKITFFSHHSDISILVEQDHALSQMRFIQGTSFVVPVKLLNTFIKDVEGIILNCISRGFIGSDEKMFDFFYLKNRDICTLIKCDWRTYFNILK